MAAPGTAPPQSAPSEMRANQIIRAQQRLLEAAHQLNLGRLLMQVPLRANPTLDTALWMFNRTLELTEIHVSARLALQLPMPQLQVLLLHELMHYLGYNQQRHHFPQEAPHRMVNIALDIALERALTLHPSWAAALAELNDRLLLDPLPEEPVQLPMSQALPLLVHARPPLHRLPPAAQQAWHYFWDDPHMPLTPEEIFRVLASLCPEALHPPESPRVSRSTWRDPHTGTICELFPRHLPEPPPEEPSQPEPQEGSSGRHPPCEAIREQLEQLPRPGALESLRSLLRGLFSRIARLAPSQPKHPQPCGTTLPRHARWARQCLEHLFTTRRQQQVVYLPYLFRPTSGELARRALGWPAFGYANHLFRRQETVVAVYVDVSGSMEKWLSDVLALLQTLEQHLPRRLFIFDTQVQEVPTREALEQFPWTGGGTDFSAVFQYALEHGHREALVLTDGLSEVSSRLLHRCHQAGVRLNAVLFCPQDELRSLDLSYWHRWVRVDRESFTLSRDDKR